MSANSSSTELCAVCSSAAAKYKCSNCYIRYCSVKCFKNHKTEICTAPKKAPSSAADSSASTGETKGVHTTNDLGPDIDEEEEAKHRLTAQDLAKLNSAHNVKRLLMDPSIRAMVNDVCKDQNPAEAIRVLRQRSDFEELVQALINATDSST
ncbi:Zinc finger HIT domain-containing protein 3 [Coemansia sp. RSA 1200]|nr:Zinc finger HIT domain-containing protein 3 [Coemansia sp. RSA 1200]